MLVQVFFPPPAQTEQHGDKAKRDEQLTIKLVRQNVKTCLKEMQKYFFFILESEIIKLDNKNKL